MPIQGVGGGPYQGSRPEETSGPKGVPGNFGNITNLSELKRLFSMAMSEQPPSMEVLSALQSQLQLVIADPSVSQALKNKLKDDLTMLKDAFRQDPQDPDTGHFDTGKVLQVLEKLEKDLRLLT